MTCVGGGVLGLLVLRVSFVSWAWWWWAGRVSDPRWVSGDLWRYGDLGRARPLCGSGCLFSGCVGGVCFTFVIIPLEVPVVGSLGRARFHWGWLAYWHRCAMRPGFWDGRNLCS